MTDVVSQSAAAAVVSSARTALKQASAAAGDPGSISVVICVFTEQRWNDILAAVDSVRRQSRPAHEIIVVVDHNPALLGMLTAELIPGAGVAGDGAPGREVPAQGAAVPLSVVANAQQRGLAGGRNTGVAVATGDVIAFLDDDAVAEPDWLRYLADSYLDDGVAGVGGLTLARWDTARPSWFPEEFDWVVGCNYRGMPASRQPVRNLLGGNASFRRPVFDVAGGFTANVGRSHARLPLGCEETEFCIRVGQRRPDLRLLIDHRAVAWHRIPSVRARFSYFLIRCYAEGLSKAQVSALVGATRGMSSERRHAFVTLPAGIVRGIGDAVRGDLSGIARAGAIASGLAAAATGYGVGTWRRRPARRRRGRWTA